MNPMDFYKIALEVNESEIGGVFNCATDSLMVVRRADMTAQLHPLEIKRE